MIEEKFVKTDEIVLFSSAQKYPRHIYDETKNKKRRLKKENQKNHAKIRLFVKENQNQQARNRNRSTIAVEEAVDY